MIYWLLSLLAFFSFFGHQPARVAGNFSILSPVPGAARLELKSPRSAALSGDDRFFLWSRRGEETQPIASITKLMTALVFLDHNPGWDKEYEITDDDHITGGRLNLFRGDRVTVRELFNTSLIASDNGATIALVHASGLSEEKFVAEMNQKAKDLGLSATSFSDPVGLGEDNVSSAKEVAFLARAALRQPEIQQATSRAGYEFLTKGGKTIKVSSTDSLLFDSAPSGLRVLGGKTGYTESAGYCFVGRFQAPDGREFVSVVLGASGREERFQESKALVRWVLDSYQAEKR